MSSEYTSQTVLNKMYGTEHVNKWADVDNDANSTTIATHITWACEMADEIVDAAMRSTHYTIPLRTSAAAVPVPIQAIASEIAMMYVRGNKGEYTPKDGDPYAARIARAFEQLELIRTNQWKINAL